jgi:hypothetical protein
MDYNYFNYNIEFTGAISKLPDGSPRTQTVDSNASDKKFAVFQISNIMAIPSVLFVSLHTTYALAERKAEKEYKHYLEAYPAYTPESIDFQVYPAHLHERKLTYFDSNGYFGNAEGQTVYDTSAWTVPMWERLRYVYLGGRAEMARHFNENDHTFVERSYYDAVTKSAKLGMMCAVCYLNVSDLI